MKPVSLDIPYSNDDLADWLTGHVLSRHLAELVSELAAIHADSTTEYHSLDEVMGSERQAVLTEGLGALPHYRLVQLLRRPTLLLNLQEMVLAEGGSPWQTSNAIDAVLEHRREACWLRLRQEIDKQQWHAFTLREAAPLPVEQRERKSPLAMIGLAIAVLALGCIIAWHFEFGPFNRTFNQQSSGWTEPTDKENARKQYLNQLAEEADKWFDRRPLTRKHLLDHMQRFRQGTLFREHSQLNLKDRQWLNSQRRDWTKTLDAERTNLKGGDDVIEVRDAVDELTRDIIAALRARAAK